MPGVRVAAEAGYQHQLLPPMLQSIDTLIAFATIMTICSLIVLTVVQMIAAALSLRGKNMANALALTFQTIDPTLADKAHKLSQHILSDPLLSDSVHTCKDKCGVTNDGHLDVLPSWLGKISHWLAHKTKMPLANAIRPAEAYAAIKKIAEQGKAMDVADAAAKDARTKAGANKGDPDLQKAATDAEAKAKAVRDASADSAVREAASSLLAALGMTTPKVIVDQKLEAVQKLIDGLKDTDARQALSTAITAASQKLVGAVQTAEKEIEGWLNAAQDRAQQWFQTHTRGFTIAVSIAFALICQLDAIEVFQTISSSAAMRQALVNASSEVSKMSDVTTDPKGGLVQRVAEAWNKDAKHTTKLDASKAAHMGELRKQLAAAGQPVLDEFDKLVDAETKGYFDDQKKKLDHLASLTSKSGFSIFPAGGWRWRPEAGSTASSGSANASNASDDKPGFFKDLGDRIWAALWLVWNAFKHHDFGSHLFGMLIFAALLTLGAPFWFNSLAKLSSLRPAIAQLMGEGDHKDEDKKK